MFELSVNIEYMFREAGDDLVDRVAAAAAAGFSKAEMFTTANRDISALGKSLDRHRVELWTVVTDPRIQLVNPSTHEEFLTMFRTAAEQAVALGCRRLVVPSGSAVPYQKRSVQLETVANAMGQALAIADELDVRILLEAVNTRVDHPGVLFSQHEDTLWVARRLDSSRVGILYDLYHSITEGEDPAAVLPKIIDHLEHVQIADVPGRGEPGSGTVDWQAQLGLLASSGYKGVIGVECEPTMASTPEALQTIQDLVAKL
jgi:hydroxypyruvate isomerase